MDKRPPIVSYAAAPIRNTAAVKCLRHMLRDTALDSLTKVTLRRQPLVTDLTKGLLIAASKPTSRPGRIPVANTSNIDRLVATNRRFKFLKVRQAPLETVVSLAISRLAPTSGFSSTLPHLSVRLATLASPDGRPLNAVSKVISLRLRPANIGHNAMFS